MAAATLERPTTAAAGRTPLRGERQEGPKPLPAWPFLAAFIAYPLWWRIGFGAFIFPMTALPMAAFMMVRGSIRVPRGFGWWLLFLAWSVATLINVHESNKLLAFVIRFSTLLAASIALVYVYNARETLTTKRVIVAVSIFWVWIVCGGYLGVLMPHGSFHTFLDYVLPHSLTKNPLVQEIVKPSFSEYNPNSMTPSSRPSAPFAYTNTWGCNFALLMPFVFSAVLMLERGMLRTGLVVLVPLSLVPAFLTLNRGMFLSLGLGLLYAAIRFGARGQRRAMIGVIAFLIAAGLLTAILPVRSLIAARVTSSNTTDKRASLYLESWQRALESPFVGYGGTVAPRDAPSGVVANTGGKIYTVPPVGTQGQLWMVLVSTGLVGTLFFMGWFCVAAWRTRRFENEVQLWMHVVILIDLVQFGYYGISPTDLTVLMTAIAIAYRERLFPQAQRARERARAQTHHPSLIPPAPQEISTVTGAA